MRIELGPDEEPEIGLIALIDCIFFLLMFFMVATSFKQQADQKADKHLPIQLPQAEVSFDPKTAVPDPLVIGVDAQGRLYLGQEGVSVQELHDRLKQVALVTPDRPVRVDGDRHANYQQVVHLLDLCAFEGMTHVSLRVRP
jgi:biopolymer transport protein ExbD